MKNPGVHGTGRRPPRPGLENHLDGPWEADDLQSTWRGERKQSWSGWVFVVAGVRGHPHGDDSGCVLT